MQTHARAQGLDVAVTITAVTTNQLTANCDTCTKAQRKRARRNRRRRSDPQSCACAPAAAINDPPTSACVLPDVAGGRRKQGRVYRLEFTAESPTGEAGAAGVWAEARD